MRARRWVILGAMAAMVAAGSGKALAREPQPGDDQGRDRFIAQGEPGDDHRGHRGG